MSLSFLKHDPEIEPIGQGRLKLQLHTPLEIVWLYAAASSLLFLVAAVGIHFFGNDGSIPAPAVVLAIMTASLAAALYRYTDNYYIVDPRRHAIMFHRKIFAYRSLKMIASFDDIAAVTVDCRKRGDEDWSSNSVASVRLWYEYFVVLVLKSKKAIRLTDSNEDSLDTSNDIAKTLATVIEAPFRPGQSGRRIRLRRNSASKDIEIFDSAYKETNWLLIVLILVIATAVILFLMISLVPIT